MAQDIQSIVSKLNPPQQDAVYHIEGPLLVLAGAGTGKTRVITCRIAWMIDRGIAPDSILGMTFTNKAAREMKERLCGMIHPQHAEKVTLGTFHSFCARILRREIEVLGFTKSYTIADEADQNGIVKQAIVDLGMASLELDTERITAQIGSWKNKMIEPEDAVNLDFHPDDRVNAKIYSRYQQILKNQNMLDFDDMLIFVHKIWKEKPEILEKYRETYKYLLVDEYQDTNTIQFMLVKMLAGDKMNLCVVGDDDQSIYGWRGAELENILNFPQYFPGAKVIKLEQNYRSTNKILNAANSVIAGSSSRFGKSLWSSRGDGENIRIAGLSNSDEEAAYVVSTIERIVANNPEFNLSDFAVLYRSNHLSRSFEQAFRRRGIRPRLIGGQEFFKRKEVRDAVAYLRLIINPRDDQSLLRIIAVPPRGIGDKAIDTLKEMGKEKKLPLSEILGSEDYLSSLSAAGKKGATELSGALNKYIERFSEAGELMDKVESFLEEAGYLHGLQRLYKNREESEKRRDNVYEFINYTALYEKSKTSPPTLTEFIESYSLMDENDRTEDDDDNDMDRPSLSTVHASKGLEFPVVFLVGLEHGIFPNERAVLENNLDEERRLFYVAVTRAKDMLFITHSQERMRYGKGNLQRPSEFLALLPENLVERSEKAPRYSRQAAGYMSDDEVAEALRKMIDSI